MASRIFRVRFRVLLDTSGEGDAKHESVRLKRTKDETKMVYTFRVSGNLDN